MNGWHHGRLSQALMPWGTKSAHGASLWVPQHQIVIFKEGIVERWNNQRHLCSSGEAIINRIRKSNMSDYFKDLLQNSIPGIQGTSNLQLLFCHHVTE